MVELQRSRECRGISLVEMLIVMALFSVAMTLFYQTIQNWIHKAHKTEVTLDLQGEALKALNWLNSEFSETTEDGVLDETRSGGDGIVFVSPRDINGRVHLDPSGRLTWQKFVCFYKGDYNGVPALLMKQVPIPSPSSELPNPPTVASVIADSSAETRLIARNVTVFLGDPDLNVPWNLTIETRGKSGSMDLGVRIETGVFFRN